jgi:hypothetical protein
MEVDLARIHHAARLLTARERSIGKTAPTDEAHTCYRLGSVPGSGQS